MTSELRGKLTESRARVQRLKGSANRCSTPTTPARKITQPSVREFRSTRSQTVDIISSSARAGSRPLRCASAMAIASKTE